jgi:hypothetical protein
VIKKKLFLDNRNFEMKEPMKQFSRDTKKIYFGA